MKKGYLSDYFSSVAWKRLSQVEVNPKKSHQHEFNATAKLKKLWGVEKFIFKAKVVYLSDDEEKCYAESSHFTWYDSRENHETRSEHRIYCEKLEVLRSAAAGDLLVMAQKGKKDITFFVARQNSSIERQLIFLFDIEEKQSVRGAGSFAVKDVEDVSLNYFTRIVLEKLGVEIHDKDDSLLDLVNTKFPGGFPDTDSFSAWARELLRDMNPVEDADNALVMCMDMEEKLFRLLEKRMVEKKLKAGFKDVDDFVSYSLSVQNRRKSRAGKALENHLKYIFDKNKIKCSFNKITENKSRPDFIFPGIGEYRNKAFPAGMLTMLGVKTSCKDRWRQVLAEANRIENKHLFTMEPGISRNQTDEMIDNRLQLVVPAQIISSFDDKQQSWLMNLNQFTEMVRNRQKRMP